MRGYSLAVFATTIFLLLAGKAGAYQSAALTGLHFNGRLLDLPEYSRLG
jgi:hypothetical protein